jgi:hypothetical protein
MQILIPISPGELIDRLTILEVKADRLTDPIKLRAVNGEYSRLHAVFVDLDLTEAGSRISPLALSHVREKLRKVNLELWDALEFLRKLGSSLDHYAMVMALNDDRARLKQQIDRMFACIGEQKSFLDNAPQDQI